MVSITSLNCTSVVFAQVLMKQKTQGELPSSLEHQRIHQKYVGVPENDPWTYNNWV